MIDKIIKLLEKYTFEYEEKLSLTMPQWVKLMKKKKYYF